MGQTDNSQMTLAITLLLIAAGIGLALGILIGHVLWG